MLTTPPFQVADEIAHFDRAFKLSEFGTFQKNIDNKSGDYVPSNIDSTFMLFRYISWDYDKKTDKQKILAANKIPLQPNKRSFINIDAGPYFYFSYLPQYPAIYIGKIFGLSVLSILYLGRFFGLLFYILCVAYAIKIIPTAKYLLMTLALMPMCLAQAASYNADCVLFSFSFLALAILLKLSFSKEPITLNKQTVLLAFILLIIGTLKFIYLPLALLVFLLPRISFKNKVRYYLVTASVVLASAICTIAWFKANPTTLSLSDTSTDAAQKMQSLIHNPFLSFKVVKSTWDYVGDIHYYQAIGILGYLDTKLPQIVYDIFGLLILFLVLFESNKIFRLTIFQRVILIVAAIPVFFMTFDSLYLVNPKQNGFVATGVQGRYFIPIIFPFLLAFNGLIPLRLNLSKYKIVAGLLFIVLFFVLLSSQLTIIDRYFE